jgi:hypothetical protein
MNEPELLVRGHDDFLGNCLKSGTTSRFSLVISLCNHVGKNDLSCSTEAERVVEDFCERHAPDLPNYGFRFRPTLKKALDCVLFAVLALLGWSYLFSLVPEPGKLLLGSVGLIFSVLFCLFGPRVSGRSKRRAFGVVQTQEN